jgi:formylglycine-generating enzyme required for sulfatase activity
LRDLPDHTGSVYDIDFSPDGRELMSCGGGDVFFWNPTLGTVSNSYSQNGAKAVAYSDDGRFYAYAGTDKAQVYDASNNTWLRELDHSDYVETMDFSPDGETLAAGLFNDDVVFWSTSDWNSTVFTEHDNQLNAVAYSPNGQYFASASQDNTVKLWDAATKDILRTWTDDFDSRDVTFDITSSHLIWASNDDKIYLASIADRQITMTIPGHGRDVTCVAVSQDGNFIASGAIDYNVILWSATTGERLQLFGGASKHTANLYDVAFCPTEQVLASAGGDDVIKLWDISPYYPTLEAGGLFAIDSIVGNLRYIPAGTFMQGSPEEEPCNGVDENQFEHTLSRDYAIMETELTREMWGDLVAAQPDLFADPSNTSESTTLAHPAQNMRWYEAVLFANLLSVEQGLARCYYADAGYTQPITAVNYDINAIFCNFEAVGYRLPTEGEWEYATRGGTTTTFFATVGTYATGTCNSTTLGVNPDLEAIAIYYPNSGLSPAVAGSVAANPWGLFDTLGNVAEWVWDDYAIYPASPESDYDGPNDRVIKSVRGGHWQDYPHEIRSAERGSKNDSARDQFTGFRLCRTIP